ncbi:hypothetical protein THAOC_08549 [Thalassiosira oceanica]|uniref:Uncharacterized protein n=1 Tax=Thalassiosira oceanica TaxID=159749 RepID=K0SYR5_THAOC|nr:hypothetical protein THAOC_08549 [Thalassiosira oceanica]|eukprot:EJK70119.1 hypothetical protein THAOC_08549 [Thalassiosira oceanica]
MDRPPSAHSVHALSEDEESAPLILSADGAFSGPAATAIPQPPPSPASARRARSRHRMASRLFQVSAVIFFVLSTVASVGHFAPDSATRLVLGARMPDFSGVDGSSASKRTEARVNRQLIGDIFRGVDPFARSRVIQPDWTYPHTNWQPVFFEHLWTQYVRPNHGTLDFYLEVGSFKGGSITRLADLLKEKCPDWRKVSLVCMDPFSGDVNMWDWNHNKGTKFGHDFLDTGPDGRPQIFERFLANVADKGHQDMVLPIVVGGLVGMKLIDRFHKTGRIDQLPSVIYLDSAHEKDETFLELEQAWKVLRECGAILGDDWAWDAVREDVVRFAEGRNLPALPIYDKYEQKTPGLVLGPKGQWFIVKNGESCKFDANGTWGSASQNVRIDAKIASIRDRGKPCSEQTTLAYAGEFGYEIQGVVPWRYNEAISTGCDLKTAGLAGTRYLYFFSKHHTTVGGHRGPLPLPNGNPIGNDPHVPELPKTNWKMPPFPSFFGEKGIRYDLRGMVPGPSNKPIAVVFNKYTLEWGNTPVNYLDIESLRSLLNILSPVYQVVYVRLESKKLGDSGEGDLQDFKDKDVIRQEYPSTILIDDLYNEATMDYNLLLFGVASQADLFVSVQGGNCVIASLWGKPNFIYAVKGGELRTGAFKNGWMGQLSGADHESFVTVYGKREELIQGVQEWMDGAALWRRS